MWWRSPPFTSQSVSSAALHSLMEPSFMADSKCVCWAAHSSVREISAKQIAVVFSTNTVPWLTFYGKISPPSMFNHPSSFNVCAYVPDRSVLTCQGWPLISWLIGRQKPFPFWTPFHAQPSLPKMFKQARKENVRAGSGTDASAGITHLQVF